jgi:hypothetical protein
MRSNHPVPMAALLPAATSAQLRTILGAMVPNVLRVRLRRLVGSWGHARLSLRGYFGQAISCGNCAAQRGRCGTVSAGAISRKSVARQFRALVAILHALLSLPCAASAMICPLLLPSIVFVSLQAAHGVSRLGAAVLCGITTVNMDGRGVNGEGTGLPADTIRTPTARASTS